MSITGIGQGGTVNPLYPPQAGQQSRRSEFQQLFSSIQSGNLSSAQQAYAALFPSGAPSDAGTSPIGQDLSTIGQALQSGSVTAAQQALTKLQTDFGAQSGSLINLTA